MDVTEEILRNHQIYGASDNTAPHNLVASRSLNYAAGLSINKPAVENISIIPFTLKYQDAVGLFGAENYFVRVDVNVDQAFSLGCFEGFYDCAELGDDDGDTSMFWNEGAIDRSQDTDTVNDYEPAYINVRPPVPIVPDPYISIDLKNLKVNNKYIDDYLDVTLYTRDKEEVGSDQMYVRLKDHFYMGVHARDTRRLPYNLELTVGQELRSGLPSTECNDTWETGPLNCVCIEEPGYECGEMEIYRETGTGYQSGDIDKDGDPTTVESYQPGRVTLQKGECITNNLSDELGIPSTGELDVVPPPKEHKNRGHLGDPCCATCH